MDKRMIAYSMHSEVGHLDHWPFDNPASQYRIVSGTPMAYGRLDAGGPGHQTRCGLWRCTEGSFECIEQGDELMTVLSGRGRLVYHSTQTEVELSPGDTLFIRDGAHVTWEINEELTKVFHGYKPGGY